MMDDTKLKGLLRNTAAGDPLGPLNPEQLVLRGERGLRRRRAISVTGVAVAVAAVTWGATTLTDIDSSNGKPPVATPKPTKVAAAELFKPIPGVPHGEAALGPLTKAEAVRRCRLKNPSDRRALMNMWGGFRGGGRALYDFNALGPHFGSDCGIPGDSRPTGHAIAVAGRDRLPATDAGKLRNCSIRLWHDITGWRIVTSETEPGELINLIAISPSGRFAARCSLTKDLSVDGLADTMIHLTNPPPDPRLPEVKRGTRDNLEHFPVAGSQTCGGVPSQKCIGWLHDEIGRVDSKIAKIRVVMPNGRVHDIKVVDGWYAFAWGDRDPKGGPDAKVTTYDASGKVVKSYN